MSTFSMHRLAARRRTLPALLAVGVLAAVGATAAPASATPAAAAVMTDVALSSSLTAVTSSTSTKLDVDLYADKSTPQGEPVTESFETDLQTPTYTESHSWSLPIKAPAFTIATSDAGTLDLPAAATGPYGTVNLTITPIGPATRQSCDATDYSLTKPVRLSGTFFFNTNSGGPHKWGTVGSATTKFTFTAGSTVETTYGLGAVACAPPYSYPCTSGVTWDAANSSYSISLYGAATSATSGYVDGTRLVKLTTPTGATRYDYAYVTSPAPKLTLLAAGAASVAVTSTAAASGSATLHSTKPATSYTSPCGSGMSEHVKDWSPATFTNGTPPLSVPEQIFGVISLTKPAGADFSIYS
jgi:hypothetical protein